MNSEIALKYKYKYFKILGNKVQKIYFIAYKIPYFSEWFFYNVDFLNSGNIN